MELSNNNNRFQKICKKSIKMKYLKLHSKPASIIYKNSLCSLSTLVVFILCLLSVIIPLLSVTLLSPHSGIIESRILYEQPHVKFQYDYLFIGSGGDGSLITCSAFKYFNDATHALQKCVEIKYSETDWNYDSLTDRIRFVLNIDANDFQLQHFYIVLFFNTKLTKKCNLQLPAVLIKHIEIPYRRVPSSVISLSGKLDLIQNDEFLCPFYGRNSKTLFRSKLVAKNASDLNEFSIQNVQKRLKNNPGYFELKLTEDYHEPSNQEEITITINIDVPQLAVRYHLSIWERLGQFWLYFASFFGISFVIVNKLKDFLFSRHHLRAWEIVPWKKLY